MEIEFEMCDFENPTHLTAVADLLQGYMGDPMGEHRPHTKLEQLRLVDGLASHPKAFVVLASAGGEAIALATCFELFSTFEVKPFINIHDLYLRDSHRGLGIGRGMLQFIAELAKERRCCKVTLEVRTDNVVAQSLYRSEGFAECEPDMLFWTKKL
ncbi:MAG: GNAT family N-acetyltransferase [Rikenellaceae bacterium]